MKLYKLMVWCALAFLILDLNACKKADENNTSPQEERLNPDGKHGLNQSSDATEAPFDSMKPDPEADQIALVEFSEVMHDFGTITSGQVVKHTYPVHNKGTKNPLIITNVIPDCSCSTLDWTRTPIPPGQSGSITIQFNSSGKHGKINRSVTVECNSKEPRHYLKFRAEVK